MTGVDMGVRASRLHPYPNMEPIRKTSTARTKAQVVLKQMEKSAHFHEDSRAMQMTVTRQGA
jgi:hypothetical protein